MPDRHNPHNSYYYKPLDQAAPIYVPPSHSTQRILPVPQKEGQTDYHYGRPGEATPFYVPEHAEHRSQQAKTKGQPKVSQSNQYPFMPQGGGQGPYGFSAMPPSQVQAPMIQPLEQPQQPPPQQKPGGGASAAGGAGMMAAMSDRRSKEEIQRLSSTNDALTKALDQAHQNTPEGNLPPTEYPRLPERTTADRRHDFGASLYNSGQASQGNPSHANFSDPADRVAAQNVGLQSHPDAQSGREIPTPQGAPGPAYAGPMPDLSALDEAYRRQSQGG